MDQQQNHYPTPAVPLPFPFDGPFPIVSPPIPPAPLLHGGHNLLHPPFFFFPITTPPPCPFFHHHHYHQQQPPLQPEEVPSVVESSGPADVLEEDWSVEEEKWDDAEMQEVFVLTDEWMEFFAKSEAKRRAAKKKQKQQRKRSN